jgi:CHASE3 domain sensor protein
MRFWLEKIRPNLIRKKQKLQDQATRALQKLSSAESGRLASTGDREEPEKEFTWLERKGYGMAAAAMLPAIFVQVPSGLAVSGSLVAGITSADQIISNATGTTTVSSGSDALSNTNGAAFTVSLSVIQIAIGITVGLFISAVVVYPLGKKRSGLFSF